MRDQPAAPAAARQ